MKASLFPRVRMGLRADTWLAIKVNESDLRPRPSSIKGRGGVVCRRTGSETRERECTWEWRWVSFRARVLWEARCSSPVLTSAKSGRCIAEIFHAVLFGTTVAKIKLVSDMTSWATKVCYISFCFPTKPIMSREWNHSTLTALDRNVSWKEIAFRCFRVVKVISYL